jgi:hypothetical protein
MIITIEDLQKLSENKHIIKNKNKYFKYIKNNPNALKAYFNLYKQYINIENKQQNLTGGSVLVISSVILGATILGGIAYAVYSIFRNKECDGVNIPEITISTIDDLKESKSVLFYNLLCKFLPQDICDQLDKSEPINSIQKIFENLTNELKIKKNNLTLQEVESKIIEPSDSSNVKNTMANIKETLNKVYIDIIINMKLGLTIIKLVYDKVAYQTFDKQFIMAYNLLSIDLIKDKKIITCIVKNYLKKYKKDEKNYKQFKEIFNNILKNINEYINELKKEVGDLHDQYYKDTLNKFDDLLVKIKNKKEKEDLITAIDEVLPYKNTQNLDVHQNLANTLIQFMNLFFIIVLHL